MSQFSQHVKESFVEIFTDDTEHIACWLTLFFTIAFGAFAFVSPIVACCKYNWSYFWFFTYMGSVPVEIILMVFTANWMCKLYDN